MTEMMLLRLPEGKVDLLEALIAVLESRKWNDTVEDVEILTDCLEQLAPEGVSLVDAIEHAWKMVRKAIVSGKKVDYQDVGDTFKTLFAGTFRLLHRVRSLGLKTSGEAERKFEGIEVIEGALARLREMETRILSGWPWPDEPVPAFEPGKLEAARQGIARGEVEDINEMIAQLENRAG